MMNRLGGRIAKLAAIPALRDAVVWSIPAMLVGAVLRAMLLSYSPYAEWGPDSMSFFEFAFKSITKHEWVYNEKRRYLYPLFLWVTALLPGATLRWTSWLQHGLGLLTLIPLGYTVRKTCVNWRIFILPVTILYAGFPAAIWYEHTMLSDAPFMMAIVWAMGGWVAWISVPDDVRRWWWFLLPFAAAILTRPAGRFLVPGLFLALVMVRAWRYLKWPHWVALAVAILGNVSIGKDKQVSLLLYRSAFALTRLETPLLAEYKAEMRPEIEEARRDFETLYARDPVLDDLLKRTQQLSGKPHWQDLGKDDALKSRVYRGLALEAARANPFGYLGLAARRMIASTDTRPSFSWQFAANGAERFDEAYQELSGPKKLRLLQMLFALPRKAPVEPWEQFQHRLSPNPGSETAKFLQGYVQWYARTVRLFSPAGAADRVLPVSQFRLGFLGWMLIAGLLIAFTPGYRSRAGGIALIGWSYMAGVYLVGGANPRFFAPGWPVLFVLLVLPWDLLIRTIFSAGPTKKGAKPVTEVQN